MKETFRKIAHDASAVMGSPWAFLCALLLILVWALSGWFFHYSNTWQLVIQTTTATLTFLMVFLIQNTQNRDANALHLKLDELIKATKPADKKLIDVEDEPEAKLQKLEKKFSRLHDKVEQQEE